MRTIKLLGALAAVLAVAAFLPAFAGASPPVPALTLTAAPSTVLAGASVALTVASAPPGATLELSRQYAGESAFTSLGSLQADAAGAAHWQGKPARNATYRVSFAGDASWSPAQADATVSVRPRITFAASGEIYEFWKETFSVLVSPAHPGGKVELQVQLAGGWTVLHTFTLGAGSRARFDWPSDRMGNLKFRAVTVPDADLASTISGTRAVLVKDPNPYHVPAGPAHLIYVRVHEYQLYYYEHGRIVRVMDCVTGKPSTPSPIGHFRIYVKDHMGGPYGAGRMAYDGIYAVHGTSEPWLLNRYPRAFSHGCTRVSNPNILWLWARCPIGTPVWNVP
jgi:hypothetical protein